MTLEEKIKVEPLRATVGPTQLRSVISTSRTTSRNNLPKRSETLPTEFGQMNGKLSLDLLLSKYLI